MLEAAEFVQPQAKPASHIMLTSASSVLALPVVPTPELVKYKSRVPYLSVMRHRLFKVKYIFLEI